MAFADDGACSLRTGICEQKACPVKGAPPSTSFFSRCQRAPALEGVASRRFYEMSRERAIIGFLGKRGQGARGWAARGEEKAKESQKGAKPPDAFSPANGRAFML